MGREGELICHVVGHPGSSFYYDWARELVPSPSPVEGDTEGRSMHGVALSHRPSCRAQAIKTAAERDSLSRPPCVRCLIAVVGLPHSAGAYGWVSRTCLRGGAVFRPASPSSSVFLCNFGRDLSFPSRGGGATVRRCGTVSFSTSGKGYFWDALESAPVSRRDCSQRRRGLGATPWGYPQNVECTGWLLFSFSAPSCLLLRMCNPRPL